MPIRLIAARPDMVASCLRSENRVVTRACMRRAALCLARLARRDRIPRSPTRARACTSLRNSHSHAMSLAATGFVPPRFVDASCQDHHAQRVDETLNTHRAPASARRALASTRRALASTRRALASTRRALGSARQVLPSARQALPSARQALPSARQALPSARQALRSTRRAPGSTRRAPGSTHRALPSARPALGSTHRALPSARQALGSTRRALARAPRAVQNPSCGETACGSTQLTLRNRARALMIGPSAGEARARTNEQHGHAYGRESRQVV